MPITKKFTIRLEDRPRTLGKLCQALAEQGINILAHQQFSHEKGKSCVRLDVGRWGAPYLVSATPVSTITTATPELNLTPIQPSLFWEFGKAVRILTNCL